MSPTIQAAYYADALQQLDATVISNHTLSRDTFLVRIAAPAIARQVVPGQFVMLRMAALDDPLIGRAWRFTTSGATTTAVPPRSIWCTSAKAN